MIKVTTEKIVNTLPTNRNIRLLKKVLRQDLYFSTRLPYANKEIREIWMNMVNTTYNSTEESIIKLHQLKSKTKINSYGNIINCYDEMKHKKYQIQEDPSAKKARGISKICHEVLIILKFLQIQPQVKNMSIKSHDLYYTVIENRNENEVVVDKNENIEIDYINFNDIIPNHYIGRRKDNVMLR